MRKERKKKKENENNSARKKKNTAAPSPTRAQAWKTKLFAFVACVLLPILEQKKHRLAPTGRKCSREAFE